MISRAIALGFVLVTNSLLTQLLLSLARLLKMKAFAECPLGVNIQVVQHDRSESRKNRVWREMPSQFLVAVHPFSIEIKASMRQGGFPRRAP